eukprot:SAG11_NODE_1194_length_5548_cov_3.456414_2_plen_172_part_00
MRSFTALAGALAAAAAAAAAAEPTKALLEPLPMSDVLLAGEWKEAERRNQEVLLGLNHTQWACHFTSTANLTSCVTSDGARWVTFVKDLEVPTQFTMGLGFIGAGNDVKPPANATVAECKGFCSASAACKALTFMQSETDANKTDSVVKCYWKTISGYTVCNSDAYGRQIA